jgi:membrane protein implicated in regulation of membrane protease activity
MATLHLPHPSPRFSAVAQVLREAFWVFALGAIACYVFFAALGAFSPSDVVGVTIAVAVLLLLWIVHAWAQGHRPEERDQRLTSARERRGF